MRESIGGVHILILILSISQVLVPVAVSRSQWALTGLCIQMAESSCGKSATLHVQSALHAALSDCKVITFYLQRVR